MVEIACPNKNTLYFTSAPYKIATKLKVQRKSNK